MKKTVSGMLLLALTVLLLTFQANRAVERRSIDAFEIQQQGELAQAIHLYDKIIQSGVSSDTLLPLLYFNRANAYFDRSRLQTAILDYTRAIRLNPDFAEAYYNRSLAYSFAGFPEMAIDDFKQAQECKKDIARTVKSEGLGYDSMKELSHAQHISHKSPAMDPRLFKRILRKTPLY